MRDRDPARAAARLDLGSDRVEVLREVRAGVDDPGGVAAHDPRVRARERVRAGVLGAHARDVQPREVRHRRSARHEAVDGTVERHGVDAAARVLPERGQALDVQRRRAHRACAAGRTGAPRGCRPRSSRRTRSARAEPGSPGSRTTTPPVIEHQPLAWLRVITGGTWPGALSPSAWRERPSNGRQPKLAPRPLPRRTKSISSTSSWPTSPIERSPSASGRRSSARGCAGRSCRSRRARRCDPRTGCRRGRCRAARRPRRGRCAGACRAGCRGSGRCRARRAGRPRRRRRRSRCRGGGRGRTAAARRCGCPRSSSICSTSRAEPASARSARRAPVLDHALVGGAVGEVDVEATRARVVGREGDRQQPLLAARGHLRADVEERRLAQTAADQDADPALLLDDEQAPAVAAAAR